MYAIHESLRNGFEGGSQQGRPCNYRYRTGFYTTRWSRAGVALGLRFFTKWMIKTSYDVDDWIILAGSVLFFITEGVKVWGEYNADPQKLPRCV